MGVKGIDPGLDMFGGWPALRGHNCRALRAGRVIGNDPGWNPPIVTKADGTDCIAEYQRSPHEQPRVARGMDAWIESVFGPLHCFTSVSYTHLRAHETPEHLVCR